MTVICTPLESMRFGLQDVQMAVCGQPCLAEGLGLHSPPHCGKCGLLGEASALSL